MENTEVAQDEDIQEAPEDDVEASEDDVVVESVVEDPQPVETQVDVTGTAVIIFCLSMIVGLLVWNTLSRRWS